MAGRAATEAVIQGRAAISVNDPGHPTPPGWARVALTDVAELGTGHTPSRKHPEYWGGDVPWIGIRDAGAHHGGVILDTAQHTNALGLANSAARLLPEGTVCLSRTASVGYVVMMGRPMATSQDFVTWTCGEAVEPRFLMQALLAEGQDIRRFGEGSTHTTIYFPEVKAFHIDLPPKAEQRRIVAKIDSLSAKSKRARDRLDHVRRLVVRYRAAILNAGYDLALAENGTATPLGEIASEFRNGLSKKPSEQPPGLPILRISAIRPGRVLMEERRYYPEDGSFDPETCRLRCGDLLFTRYNGNPEFVAVCGMVGELDETVLYPDKLIRVRVRDTVVLPAFIGLIANSGRFRATIQNAIKTAAGQHGISGADLKRASIPVPSLQDQSRILRIVSSAFTWIDRLATEAASAHKLIDRLDQAVLAKAFRGELVPQDLDDEPASVLLERIKAESASNERGRRKRG